MKQSARCKALPRHSELRRARVGLVGPERELESIGVAWVLRSCALNRFGLLAPSPAPWANGEAEPNCYGCFWPGSVSNELAQGACALPGDVSMRCKVRREACAAP